MSRSLSLAAYLAYARRGPARPYTPSRERPSGPLFWAHAADSGHAGALLQLFDRLRLYRPKLSLLLTSTDTPPATPYRDRTEVIFEQLPEDSVATAEAFLGCWRPDIALWTGGGLQPALLDRTAEMHIPIALVDATESALARPAWRWFPDLPRALLRQFEFVMARDEASARFLRRMGVPERVVSVTGPLLEGTVSLPYNESDRADLAATLLGRPIWLAAMIRPEEIETVLDAHREISRFSHRTLLVMAPETPEETAPFRAALGDAGMRHITWSEGALPDETTQVILADTRGEMGLWYRLAPTTFLGSSLVSGAHGYDPNEPAAHGSAILYGPNIRRYLNSYSRFAEAGAARIVRDAETLAAAVKRLIPPDQSAGMAHAAWEVASRSAGLTDRIADLLNDRLDRLEEH
ncbi:3-deoxy-D-manno-octulosonic acid transferase [Roseovarius sp. THAF27]|uniref:3-deoxy-D-manno-octulosonic acid transferase n=1 Tax=unclassified Roseovarius TaxID=2614913 RepID=UPI001268A81D|nr:MULTISPECIES: glycosyltransferase N-terminal domain-containing protein [unclassified Roseovarius]QFT79175.1 3-deoxy-D-manno-octulosonic acid transferase [Roseovarius sp. THAF27]QFT97670.1 3-deoxy-D-manno-octulosonic acid transferase [Roseovarius sp. THAF8]